MKLRNLSISIATLAVLSGLLLATAGARLRDRIPPVAEAGPNQTVNQGALVHFDGSGSTDNRGIISYTWTFVDGISRKLIGENPTYTFTNAGIYTATLNVTDAAGNWDTDSMTVTVRDVTPPIAQAGSNQTVNEGTLVHFSGSGSSDNVGIVSYVWTFMDGTAKTLNGISPTYTFHVPGIYLVTLNVTDTAGNWKMDTVTITVAVLDATPPTILTPIQSPASNVTAAQTVKISANITDAGSGVKNATLLYWINNGPLRTRVLSHNVATGYYETTIPGQLAGAWVKFEIKAYDNAGNYRVENNAGQYYVYQVNIPEFPSLLAVFLLMAATLLILIISKRKHGMNSISSFWKKLFHDTSARY
jgi:PKD repeat protein